MTDENVDALRDELWSLDFDVGKSIRYHAYRRSFWSAFDHWSKILSIVTGAAVVVTAFEKNGAGLTQLFAIVVALSSAADVVLGFSDRANKHDQLYKDWCRLQSKIVALEAKTPTLPEVVELKNRRLRIERDEPGVIDLLERRCAAEEAVARGTPPEDFDPLWRLRPWQVWLSQWAMLPAAPRLPSRPG